mgnify:CR=1 FL=1
MIKTTQRQLGRPRWIESSQQYDVEDEGAEFLDDWFENVDDASPHEEAQHGHARTRVEIESLNPRFAGIDSVEDGNKCFSCCCSTNVSTTLWLAVQWKISHAHKSSSTKRSPSSQTNHPFLSCLYTHFRVPF